MSTVIRREVRERGVFGGLFLAIFLVFNAAMVVWLLSYWSEVGKLAVTGEAEKIGHLIGLSLGSGFILMIWAAGAVITGLLALLTRGQRVLIEETVDRIEPTIPMPPKSWAERDAEILRSMDAVINPPKR